MEGAKRRIILECVEIRRNQKCFYCGTADEARIAALDRLDNEGIYSNTNVVVCCYMQWNEGVFGSIDFH